MYDDKKTTVKVMSKRRLCEARALADHAIGVFHCRSEIHDGLVGQLIGLA